MRRSSLAALAPFALAVASLSASPLGCAKGLNSTGTDGSDVGGAGGQSETASASTSSVTTGGGVCDDTGTCETCSSCAIKGECSAPYSTCIDDPDCLGFDDCIGKCAKGDSACLDDCGVLHPFGEQEFVEYAFCLVCSACYGDCGGTTDTCN